MKEPKGTARREKSRNPKEDLATVLTLTDADDVSETPRFELSELDVTPRNETNATYMTTDV